MMIFSALLKADYPERNIRRSYCIEAGRDLFGDWVVEIHYGRIDCKGKNKVFPVENEEEAKKEVRIRLRKRERLVKKVGVGYSLIRIFGEYWLGEK